MDSYQVARDRSERVVASLGSWDPSAFKRVLILGYGGVEHAMRRPINWLLARAGVHPLPEPGKPLRTRYALCPLAAPGHERALAALIARLRSNSRDITALLLAFPEGDPRNRIVRRFCRFTNVNLPLLFPLTRDCESELRLNPPQTLYIEYAFA